MKEDDVKTIGKYSYYMEKCLGVGSFGRVFKGFQNTTMAEVAVKKVDFKTLEKDSYLMKAIHQQIEILSKFNHPNIVRLHEVLRSKRSLYIIMDFCRNGDLKGYLKEKGKRGVSEEEAFGIMRQVTLGYRELARENTIHRDLKPANILRDNDNFLICDFGFSKVILDPTVPLHTCVGSPVYMAPQILEKQDYSAKCDIWSLGIIYYQLLHGDVPWKANSQRQLLLGIKQIPLTFQKGSLPVQNIIRLMLEKNQRRRATLIDLLEFFSLKQDSSVNEQLIAQNQQLGAHTVDNVKKVKSVDQKNTQTMRPVVKVINKSYFEQLGWRYFVCIEIRQRLKQLKSFNLRVNTFERLLVMISSSIVSNMRRRMEQIQRIHEKDVLNSVLADFQQYVNFRSQFLSELVNNFSTCDIPKEFQIQSIFREDYSDEKGIVHAESCLNTKIAQVFKRLMGQIKKCQHEEQKESLIYIAELIIDMITLNEQITKSGTCALEDILQERSINKPYQRIKFKSGEPKNNQFF